MTIGREAIDKKIGYICAIMKINVTIIGAGNMGGAVARGLTKSSLVSHVTCVDPSVEALARLHQTGVRTTSEVSVAGADIVILAVKPYLVKEVMRSLRLDHARQMFVSLAAGISLDELDEIAAVDHWTRFRVMPNTAIAVGQSMTFVAARGATTEQVALIEGLFGELGRVMVVPERLMEAGMAVASCGIAFAMRYVRAAMTAAIEAGLTPDDARRVVLQTVRGAVELLESSGQHPEAEIDRVTTPAGYTIRGLAALDAAGFNAAVASAIRACL